MFVFFFTFTKIETYFNKILNFKTEGKILDMVMKMSCIHFMLNVKQFVNVKPK